MMAILSDLFEFIKIFGTILGIAAFFFGRERALAWMAKSAKHPLVKRIFATALVLSLLAAVDWALYRVAHKEFLMLDDPFVKVWSTSIIASLCAFFNTLILRDLVAIIRQRTFAMISPSVDFMRLEPQLQPLSENKERKAATIHDAYDVQELTAKSLLALQTRVNVLGSSGWKQRGKISNIRCDNVETWTVQVVKTKKPHNN